MTPAELITSVHLSPRACVLTGQLAERMKKGSPATNPHYAQDDAALVSYLAHGEPDTALVRPNQAEIEFGFTEIRETMVPGIQSLYGGAKGFYNLVQVSYGRPGLGPTTPELRVLLEAGRMIDQIRRAKTLVHMVVLPVLTAGKYGAVGGRFYLLGLWDAHSGAPLWVNPHALLNKALVSDFPAHQLQREVLENAGAGPRIGSTGRPTWFDELAVAFDGLRGAVLKNKVFAARGRYLHKEGLAASPEDGARFAAEDYESIVSRTPPSPAADAPAQGLPPAPSTSRAAVLGQQK